MEWFNIKGLQGQIARFVHETADEPFTDRTFRTKRAISSPRSALKCDTVDGGKPRFGCGIPRTGRITATVPVLRTGECHARGLPSSDLRRKMPDIRDGERRAFERGHRRAAGPPSGHHIAGDPTQRRRAGIPAGTGVEEGHRAPERGLFGPGEADGGAPGEGRGEAGEGWSPERVSGRLRLEDTGMVGRQRIYDLVRADGRDGGTPCGHLRRRGKEPDRQGGRHAGRGHIPGRRDIPERPKEGGAKAGTGDREADTVIGGGHGGAVVSPVDGCPEFTPVQRVDGKRAEAVGGAMTDLPDAPPLVGAGPERAHQRAAAPVPAEGDRPAAGHGRPREAGPGHPERARPQGTRPPDAGGGFRAGAASLRRFAPTGEREFRRRARPVSVGPPPPSPGRARHLPHNGLRVGRQLRSPGRARHLPPRGPAAAGRPGYAPIRRDSRRVPRGIRAPGRKSLNTGPPPPLGPRPRSGDGPVLHFGLEVGIPNLKRTLIFATFNAKHTVCVPAHQRRTR